MDQCAHRPASPAAGRQCVRGWTRAGLLALAVQTAAIFCAHAGTTAPSAGKAFDAARAAAGMKAAPDGRTSEFPLIRASLRRETLQPTVNKIRVAPSRKPVSPLEIYLTRRHGQAGPGVGNETETGSRRRNAGHPARLFGSTGQAVALSPVSKRWQRALDLFRAEGADTAKLSRHHFSRYSTILDKLASRRRGVQIPQVNSLVNRLLAYREDERIWNTVEYWASPAETLSRRAGDCEDYAILKYALLRDLGIEDRDMRIVVLRNTADGNHHAVLSVRHQGTWLILDNRFERIRFERDLPHYQALYSLNASGEWAHVQTGGTPVRLSARLEPDAPDRPVEVSSVQSRQVR